jgi:phage I-like protein
MMLCRHHHGGMSRKTAPHIAALSLEITPREDGLLHILPAGEFRARDGRPTEVPAWRMTAQTAARIIASAAAQRVQYVVDYEHQTLRAAQNGAPNPAAGWIAPASLTWIEPGEGEPGGLYGAVTWTERANSYIAANEYKYQSPVFAYDDKTGDVLALLHVAITNTPALDDLQDLNLAAASYQFTPEQPTSENTVDKVALCKALGLPETASDEEINAKIAALTTQADQTAALTSQVAALSTQVNADPDPAKYVPIAALTALQTEMAQLKSSAGTGELEQLVTAALSDGRLIPAMEDWAREFGKKDLAGFKNYLEAVPKIAALSSQQSSGRDTKTGGGQVTVTGDALAICSQLGLAPADIQQSQGA